MKPPARLRIPGFTLIEVMTAMLILSILALMSYRGLTAVLDARAHVTEETQKWRRAAAFFARFERDVQMAAPRPVRIASGEAAAWIGRMDLSPNPRLEFSRFGSIEGVDSARRIAYQINEKQEIELWLWAGLDIAPAAVPARYVVLAGVTAFDLQYLNADSVWVNVWPTSRLDAPIPKAVRLHIVLASKEELVRVFALKL